MQEIMKVDRIKKLHGQGLLIIGVNPELDILTRSEIQTLITENIEIHNPSGSVIKSPVLGFEVTNSLIDKKNILMILPSEIDRQAVERGAIVYSI